jgi:hypothetical protein
MVARDLPACPVHNGCGDVMRGLLPPPNIHRICTFGRLGACQNRTVPLVLVGVLFAMMLLSLPATWVPAGRVLAIDPSRLLRNPCRSTSNRTTEHDHCLLPHSPESPRAWLLLPGERHSKALRKRHIVGPRFSRWYAHGPTARRLLRGGRRSAFGAATDCGERRRRMPHKGFYRETSFGLLDSVGCICAVVDLRRRQLPD